MKRFIQAMYNNYLKYAKYYNATGLICAFTIDIDTIKMLCIWLILVKILEKKNTSNIVNNNYELKQPMQVQTMNFANKEVMSDALNRQLDSDYKVNMILKLIENGDIYEWVDEELNNLIEVYKKASRNVWREQKVQDYETKKIIEIRNKTEEEYQEAVKKRDETLENLKKYLKKKI